MLNRLDEAALVVDLQGEIFECNDIASRELGYTIEEIQGVNIGEILFVEGDEIDKLLGIREKGIHTQLKFKTGNEECLLVSAEVGYQQWLKQGHIYILFDSRGNGNDSKGRYQPICIKHYDEVLQGKEELEYGKLYKQYQYMQMVYHPKLLDEIFDEIRNHLDFRALGIYLYDENMNQLALLAGSGLLKEEFKDMRLVDLENSISGKAYCMNRPQKYSLVEYDYPHTRELLARTGSDAVESHPIAFGEEVLGAMSFVYRDTNEREKYKPYLRAVTNKIAMLAKSMLLNQLMNQELNQRIQVEEEMELFFNCTTEMVAILTETGKIKRIGNEFFVKSGWSKEDLLRLNFFDLFYDDDHKVVREEMEYIAVEGVGRPKTLRLKTRSGEECWIAWNGRYIKDRRLYVCSGRDVTQEKKNEEKRLVLEKAVARESVKNELFTNLSHEFRTPLNIILSALQLIEQKRDFAGEEKGLLNALDRYLPLMKQNGYRLLRLVNNLLDLTKIDAGHYEVRLANYDIVKLVEEITMSVADYIKGQEIRLIFDTDIEEKIMACNPEAMERIMLNLLSNSMKYAKENGKIDVNIYDGDDVVTIVVADNGVGIEEVQQEIIFDRFMQVDGSLTRKCEGTGLGLSLVKSLVELQGGSIGVRSKVGEGTEFSIVLPVTLVEGQESRVDEYPELSGYGERCNVEFSDIYV